MTVAIYRADLEDMRCDFVADQLGRAHPGVELGGGQLVLELLEGLVPGLDGRGGRLFGRGLVQIGAGVFAGWGGGVQERRQVSGKIGRHFPVAGDVLSV